MFGILNTKFPNRRDRVRVLDVGCGSGRITKNIVDAGFAVSAYDISEVAVKKAKQLGIKAKVADLETGIPEKTGSVHAVWAGDIIEHLFDPINFLNEINRVLVPGGVLIASIPSDVGLITRLLVLIGRSYQQPMYEKSGFYKHHTFFTEQLIRFMLKTSGFVKVKVSKILVHGKHQIVSDFLPSFLFNEMVVFAVK